MTDKKLDSTTREQALRVARMLGCQGAHEHPNGWMPCASHEEYEAIKKGKEEYLKVLAAKKKKPLPKMVQRTKRLETKSDAYYENRADALSISKARGCGGVRTVMLAGKRYYTPCDHKPRKGWEKLDEKPITGIATLPGGGLVTGSFSGKSVEDDVEQKGFVNFVSRSTDPDTFSDPESARIRARNIGCIGIRRYTARDGKLVWMPCTNVSDYNRVTGIRGDNSPRNNPRRQGSGFKKKALGTPIGASSSGAQQITDGDGDGYVASIPGGPDDTPVRKRNQNPAIRGQIEKGNIDLNNRPVVRNSDGSISTVRSISITEGRVTVLIPTVIRDKKGRGKVVSDRDAIRHYQRSGEHLGKFSSSGDADRYAEQLHNQQAAQYSGKSLGMPIGAKPSNENVDGDGDGFTTGGIVGGEDKIPVAPKLIRRTLQEKFKNGPQKFIGGMENGRNIPRVLSDKESRERYGNTRLGMQDYFQKKYGIKLEFPQETKDQKTARLETIKEDLRLGNTLMSEKDVNKEAKRINNILNERIALAKELWKYLENPNAKETPKDYSLRTQTYPRFYEQAKNMLAEVHGSMQALEDLLLNANLSEEDKSKFSLRLNLQDFDNPALDPEGYADVKRDKDGKAIISMNVMFKSWAFTLDGEEDTQRLASWNAMGLQLGEVPAQVGTRFEAPLAGGENRIKIIQDLRRALDEMRDGEFFRRKGYATTVHEFAHVLDALAYENLEKWITQNPDDAEARQRLAKMKFLESMNDNNRANFLSLALMTSISENNPQISKYAAISFPERFAEQFTAWFLFSKAKGLFGDEEMRKRNADDEVEDVLGLHLDIQMKRTSIIPKIEKISSNFQKIMTRRHPVGQFIFGGLSNPKKKPKDTPAKGMSEGVVLFKGVPKARKKPPTVTSTDINNLAIRVRQHNAKAKPAQRANLRDLKNVYLRGLEDGDKTSANKRVSKFLSLLMSDKPKDVKYFDDNDLLPLDHPWRNRKTTKKWAGFDEGEYGVKYAEKCCPKVVKRYRPK